MPSTCVKTNALFSLGLYEAISGVLVVIIQSKVVKVIVVGGSGEYEGRGWNKLFSYNTDKLY